MKDRTHEIAMKITKVLIESGLSINDQVKVIQNVKQRLEFCKTVGNEIKKLNQLQLWK